MKSVMTHQFSMAPTVGISRSKFDRSFGHKTTFDSGYVVPFYCDEVLPGDTFDVEATLFVRETTQIVPIMDNLTLTTFFLFVPNRLLWEHWQNFCGEQEEPGDSIDYLIPQISAPDGGFSVGSIFDYLGIPVNVGNLKVNALPFRAINLIYNEWFRDENLINKLKVNKTDSGDLSTDYNLFRRGKRYDYFTSCLPWPQKGPGVELPLGSYAPVFAGDEVHSLSYGSHGINPISFSVKYGNTGSWSDVIYSGRNLGINTDGNLTSLYESVFKSSNTSTDKNSRGLTSSLPDSGISSTLFDLTTPNNLYADLSQATSATINSLRQAFTLQAFYEQWARGGTRYTEILRSFFQVISPDARLQRPEYLGGSVTRINATPVAQTMSTDTTSPQGNLAAYTVSASDGHGFVKSFVEHGYVFGFVCIDADLTYQQGLERMWSRRTLFDFYWPTFAHLGEQAVLNQEIYAQGTDVDTEVFGYQERYAEYRYKNSMITGKMRSGLSDSLDVWHLSQYFEDLPTLSQKFIESNPPVKRSLAVQNEPEFLADIYVRNICIRPMPLYGVPATIGRHM